MEKKPLASPAVVPRVNVLAFPAPTTGLYLLFIAALLAVGLFVGSWMHNVVLGKEWIQALKGCLPLEVDQQRGCTAPAEFRRGLWSLAGALLVAGLAVVVLFAVPSVIRRRRLLKPPMAKHEAVVKRFAELASQAGLLRMPKLYIGPARMGDAFSFGRPGSPAVALPPKIVGLLVRPGPADGVLLHEFAHIRHRDVELAWMARSAWYVALLVLLFPIVGALWEGPSILPFYLWRAALLAVVVEIVTAALLRAREHDADLRATAELPSFEAVRSGLGLLGAGIPRNWLRRLRMRHPTRSERLDVLESPHLAAGSSLLQALSAGFLAGVLGPLVVSTATPLLAGTDITLGGIWTSAAVTGSLLGLTVGLDVWRSQFVDTLARGTDGPGLQRLHGVFTTAVGVSMGLALGQLVSLAGIGQDVSAAFDPMTLIAPIVVGLGTVFICAAFGAVCLPLAHLVTRPWHFWLPAVVLNIAIFLVATWMGDSLDLALTGFGYSGAYLWTQYGYDEWPGIALAVLLTVVALLASLMEPTSRRRGTRDWMYFPGHTSGSTHSRPALSATGSTLRFPLFLGFAAGLAGSIFLVSQLLLISPINSNGAAAQANYIWVWTTVVCWIASGAILCLINPVTGPAQVFIAGPLSLGLCALGVAVFWFASTDSAPLDVLLSIWSPAMARGLAVSIMLVGLVVPIRYAIRVAAHPRYRKGPRRVR
ncbi:M56 family metallopeptidase [Arthrobacter sp. FB24]|uniref:M56 family metallopeptidase n=1 Tax=Arthrobacter sp. (strain FB24) TaxID=290399 RepID=UPI0000526E36|nr:M56 family metallopeptidase [Arthrobacter sp. FB24]